MINKEHQKASQEYTIAVLKAQLAATIYATKGNLSHAGAVSNAAEILKEAGVYKAFDNLQKVMYKNKTLL